MRKRTEILKDYAKTDQLILEILLDIRDILVKQSRKRKKKEVG